MVDHGGQGCQASQQQKAPQEGDEQACKQAQADSLPTHQPACPYRLPLDALPSANYGLRGPGDSGLPMMAIM